MTQFAGDLPTAGLVIYGLPDYSEPGTEGHGFERYSNV